MSTTLTIRIDEQVKKRLDRLAGATSRSKSYLISNAIEDFLSVNEWQINETIKAILEADKPGAEFIDHEELMAKWKAKLENTVD